MKPSRIEKSELLAQLPDPWPVDPKPRILELLGQCRSKVVVLDDDPTGTQTVHDIPVLTRWSADVLQTELLAPEPAFYILTNSRSLPPEAAFSLNRQVGRELMAASEKAGRKFVVVSRSDSTLRGHFPDEMDALTGILGGRFDAWILVPFFEEGERYTINNIHYLAQDRTLVPVGQSEYADDPAFGYSASDLRDWVTEKTGGRFPAKTVASISIEDLRIGGPAAVTGKLTGLSDNRICVVNAASYRDLEVFTQGLLVAEGRGKRFLYRSAASFVQVRAGISSRPLLSASELCPPSGGALTIVGSYVPKTSTQLDNLLSRTTAEPLELIADRLLDAQNREQEIARVRRAAQEALIRGDDVVVYTSRQLLAGADADSSLQIGQQISDALIAVLRGVTVRPSFVIAKGGITSSVLATDGLDVRRAVVCGQILPGIPVWRLGAESRFPEMIYVVFPGNVGAPSALTDVFEKLKRN